MSCRQVGADGGEAALAAWPAAGPAPEAAFAAVAKHLTNQGLSPEQAAQLSGVPLVPVAAGSRLIAAGRLFARLPQDLAPFAYEVRQSWQPHLQFVNLRLLL